MGRKCTPTYDILDETMCIYCSGREFSAPQYLQRHVATKHPGTYADHAIKEAKERWAERRAEMAKGAR